MSNRTRPVETIAEAAIVYGGPRKMAKAFRLKGRSPIAEWMAQGNVPRGHQLGLYIGLRERGRQVSPRLMGVVTWDEIAGVAKDF